MSKINPEFKPGYYYLHVNGRIIWKPKIVVETDETYFDSPLVVKYWEVNTEQEYQNMVVEAKKMS